MSMMIRRSPDSRRWVVFALVLALGISPVVIAVSATQADAAYYYTKKQTKKVYRACGRVRKGGRPYQFVRQTTGYTRKFSNPTSYHNPVHINSKSTVRHRRCSPDRPMNVGKLFLKHQVIFNGVNINISGNLGGGSVSAGLTETRITWKDSRRNAAYLSYDVGFKIDPGGIVYRITTRNNATLRQNGRNRALAPISVARYM